MLMWLETVWKSMPRINFITSKAVSFSWWTPKCVAFFVSVTWSFGSFNSEKSPTSCSFPRHLGTGWVPQSVADCGALCWATSVMWTSTRARDWGLERYPLIPLGKVWGKIFLGHKTKYLFSESFKATSLPGLFFRSFSITYMFKKKNKNSGTVRSQLERSWDFHIQLLLRKIPGQSRWLRGRDSLRGRCWRNATSAETLNDAG